MHGLVKRNNKRWKFTNPLVKNEKIQLKNNRIVNKYIAVTSNLYEKYFLKRNLNLITKSSNFPTIFKVHDLKRKKNRSFKDRSAMVKNQVVCREKQELLQHHSPTWKELNQK